MKTLNDFPIGAKCTVQKHLGYDPDSYGHKVMRILAAYHSSFFKGSGIAVAVDGLSHVIDADLVTVFGVSNISLTDVLEINDRQQARLIELHVALTDIQDILNKIKS